MILPVIAFRLGRVILDVDTQRHFFRRSSIACVQDHRQVLANILRVLNWAQMKRVRRISTVQTFQDNCSCGWWRKWLEAEAKVIHTVRGRHTSFFASDSTDLWPGLLEEYEQVIFHKRCFDPFEEPRVDRMLTELDPAEFVVVGAAMEGAVEATALGLLARGKKVTVVADAVGSYDRRMGGLALRIISERGGNLTTTRALLDSHCGQPSGLFEFGLR